MTPGATVEAAIGLLVDIEKRQAPADDIVATYFRRHRFAGSSDRAAISAHIYAVLRHRAMLDWWIERAGEGTRNDARPRLLAALVLVEGWTASEVRAACDGDRFRPRALSQPENAMVSSLAGRAIEHPDMPSPVRGNYPEWLGPHLAAALGSDLDREMAALNREAGLDLRVNPLKGVDRAEVRIALKRENVETELTPLSPLGLRVTERVPLGQLAAFRDGLIEVQDEGSQVAALLADARPGMRVVDFCAGAGGKTLALAGTMRNRGHLVACDVSAKRLERATERLRRAGASIVQRVPLANARDKWVKRHDATFDRVFVDAPCTGTGTWRRNPDAKWRLQPKDLVELPALQAEILDSAQRLVKPGGRLIYATCSLLREEDEAQVEAFLARYPLFDLVPAWRVWRDTIGGNAPEKAAMLRLSPARHGTDGFFVAVMERKPDPPKNQAFG
ncbi:MAG TPA: RsmB/NOP family class I SAM-dependent RNA methyltransferase [Stellaceae bacterium]|nr:RsmB/NOP family class I SAM-dependent RNA methyltransferase [Stellaceae bacterium]